MNCAYITPPGSYNAQFAVLISLPGAVTVSWSNKSCLKKTEVSRHFHEQLFTRCTVLDWEATTLTFQPPRTTSTVKLLQGFFFSWGRVWQITQKNLCMCVLLSVINWGKSQVSPPLYETQYLAIYFNYSYCCSNQIDAEWKIVAAVKKCCCC